VPLELPAGGRIRRAFSWPGERATTLEATLVAPEGDALLADDRGFVALPAPAPRRVLVVGAPDLYLEGALLSFGGALAVERREAAAEATDWSRYDAVIFDGVAPAPAPREGRFLYLDPAGPGSPFPERGIVRDPIPSDFDREHPLLRHLTLADLNVREARRWTVEPADEVVAASLGAPLLVARARGTLRIVALPFDLRRSDLPLRPLMPLLLANVLDWLAAGEPVGEDTSFATGAVARVRLARDATAAVVTDPRAQVSSHPLLGDGWLDLPLLHSGVYEIVAGGGGPVVVAASFVDEGESDTRAAAVPAFARLPPARLAAGTTSGGALALGAWAALAAAVLLLLEWWAYHRRWTV
jgi:hypothetical protein